MDTLSKKLVIQTFFSTYLIEAICTQFIVKFVEHTLALNDP